MIAASLKRILQSEVSQDVNKQYPPANTHQELKHLMTLDTSFLNKEEQENLGKLFGLQAPAQGIIIAEHSTKRRCQCPISEQQNSPQPSINLAVVPSVGRNWQSIR